MILMTDNNKLLMQWRGPYIVESRVGVNDYRVKMGSKTKMYHLLTRKRFSEKNNSCVYKYHSIHTRLLYNCMT